MSSYARPLTLSKDDAALHNWAVSSLEAIHDATLYGVLMADKRGVFIYFRPGHEVHAARFMSGIDWPSVIRNAEEHAE